MTNIFKNRSAVFAAQNRNKPYVVLVPRRFELIHSDDPDASRKQEAAVIAARQKNVVQLNKILEGHDTTADEFMSFVNDPDCPFITIVPLSNSLFDVTRWVIDFVAFPNCNWSKLEAQGAL